MTINDRPPNYRNSDGVLCIVRCFACSPEYGRLNWVIACPQGYCAWCDWDDTDPTPPLREGGIIPPGKAVIVGDGTTETHVPGAHQ